MTTNPFKMPSGPQFLHALTNQQRPYSLRPQNTTPNTRPLPNVAKPGSLTVPGAPSLKSLTILLSGAPRRNRCTSSTPMWAPSRALKSYTAKRPWRLIGTTCKSHRQWIHTTSLRSRRKNWLKNWGSVCKRVGIIRCRAVSLSLMSIWTVNQSYQ